jgi:hypothetical protein
MIEKIIKFTFMAAVLVGFAFFAGCGDDIASSGDGDGGGDPAAIERIISFSSSPSEISFGSESTVSGLVVDSANAGIQGRQVVLSVLPETAGYFIPAAVTSGTDGSFEATFYPLDTGSVEIWAVITSSQVSANLTTEVVAGEDLQTGEWRFNFAAVPDFTLADGDDVSTVTAEILDPDGNTVPDGIEVRLEAGERFNDVDGNGYFTENVDQVLVDINGNEIWDRVGSVPSTVTTSGGQIQFDYTAGTISGLIYIRATLFDNGEANSGEFPMVLRPGNEIASIALTTDRSEIQVKATGGIEFANLTAVCFDAYGNKVQSELPVDFFFVYGPEGGERFTISEYDSTQTSPDTLTAYTNVVGEVTATVFSGIKSGTVMIQAESGDILSNATLININAGPAFEMSVGVNPCNIRGWDVVNEQANVVAMVNDKYGNPVMDSTEVFFWTDEGMVTAASITESGLGEAVYSSGDPRGDGLAIIRAETAGGTVVDSTILIVSGPAYTITAYGYALELMADGEDYTDIWVDARDVNDNFMTDGTPVEILFNDGTTLNGNLSDGCYSSLERIRYKSTTLTRDYVYSVPDNGIGRYLEGYAQAGGVMGPSDAISIILHTGPANTERSEVRVSSTAAPGSSEPVDVVIMDRAGNPLGGHLIEATANLGTLSPTSATTNAYGEVGFIYTAPGAIGNDYITISDEDPGYGGIVMTKKIKIDITD